MPFLGIGLHVLVALFFAVHALKSQQNMYWLLILFSFPLLGSIVYFFAIYLPELKTSRIARTATRTLVNIADPVRELRAAEQAFEMTPTVGNRIRLAAALLDSGNPEAALEQYQQGVNGAFANDPELLSGMARAQMELGDAEATLKTLEKLFAIHPKRQQHAALALLYARSLAANQSANTRAAFNAALTVADGPESKCHYADWLAARNDEADRTKARALYEEVINDSRHWNNRHTKNLNRQWLQHAREALAGNEK
ncbi:hypothetical protein FACS189441_3310 [Betaproteobacteria bacterium]|nr:hypothetical protein FACS189441_3310 [Betaproteobacteria bacterium]